MKWLPRTKRFDSSLPANTVDVFECWDFRRSKHKNKVLDGYISSEEMLKEEIEIERSKLKVKQDRKMKEK